MFGAQAARCGLGTDAGIGEHHRQQDQVGEHQQGDADRGGDGQVLDHRDVDQHQHPEAHGVGDQRSDPGEEQAAEGVPRSHQLMGAAGHVLHDAVHLLRAMGHADGEHQKRHEDRVRVELVTQPGNQPELPEHGDAGTAEHQRGAAHTTGPGKNDQRRDQGRHGEVDDHLLQAIEQVADHLGEADDTDIQVGAALIAGVLGANAFQALGQLPVVQRFTAVAVLVEQRQENHARTKIRTHQVAEQLGAADVLAQGIDAGLRAGVVVGHHRAAGEALFGDLVPAHHRHPQRLDVGPVNAGGQEQRVVDVLEGLQVGRLENIARAVLDHHAHGIAQALELVTVVKEVADVRLVLRDGFLERGVERQAGRIPPQDHRHHRTEEDDQQAVVEDQALQATA
ncbi:hypothetical protein D3C77_256110 [compost metagenome]